jgi:hypothetical protein
MDGPQELAAFIAAHQTYTFVCHDAAVDFHLVKRYLERNGAPPSPTHHTWRVCPLLAYL